jgi:hypothetical protein
MGGKVLFETQVINQKEVNTFLEAPQGIYFVNAADEQGVKTVRIIKL